MSDSESIYNNIKKIVPPDGRLVECGDCSKHLRDAKNSLSIALRMIDYADAPLYDEVVELHKHLAFMLWAMSKGRNPNV